MSFFNELKRRNVFRVGLAYIVSAWVIAQVADLVLDSIKAPDWVMQALLLGLGLGFIVALIIAWAYELTPEGIKKEQDVIRDDSVTNMTAKKLDYITLAGVLLVVALFVYQQMNPSELRPDVGNQVDSESTAQVETASTEAKLKVTEKSIAVLPFIPLSANDNDAYFGKGIAEELLNALAKFPELKVAARTSAFSFDGKDVDLREVGSILGVAHVLEGSVRSAGDKVRVTAQLIRASDGFHLWSETYDRDMADIFKVQDDIVSEINRTLQIRLGVGVGADRVAAKQVDPIAYQNYLLGLEFWGMREEDKNRSAAIKAFQLATSQDPNFADAWAAYGVSLSHSNSENSGMNEGQHKVEAIGALNTALKLDADNVRALAGLGVYYFSQELDVVGATAYLKSALELAPNSAEALYSWTFIPALSGGLAGVRLAFNQAIANDPLNQTINRVYAENLASMGDHAAVLEFLEKCDACTLSDQSQLAAALYMAARRNGSDDQVRLAAAKHHALLNKHSSHFVSSSEKNLLARQLVLSSPALVDMLLGGTALSEQEINAIRSLPTAYGTFDQPIVFAQIGAIDFALSLLDDAYNTALTDLYWITQPMGRDVWPDGVRRDPRFHAFWQKPGMPELATLLREKGKTLGLPLPLEGNDQ